MSQQGRVRVRLLGVQLAWAQHSLWLSAVRWTSLPFPPMDVGAAQRPWTWNTRPLSREGTAEGCWLLTPQDFWLCFLRLRLA